MCLSIDKDIKIKFDKTGKVTAYKLYDSGLDSKGKFFLVSIYKGQRISKPGQITSNRKQIKLTRYEEYEGVVNRGIHVFLRKLDIVQYKMQGELVIPVLCNKKDLIAKGTFGYWDRAVFMKATIEKQIWDNIFSKKD